MIFEVTSPASDLGWEEREDALDLVPQYRIEGPNCPECGYPLDPGPCLCRALAEVRRRKQASKGEL